MSLAFKRIVCATDFSECSLKALELAALIAAGDQDSFIQLIHVSPTVLVPLSGSVVKAVDAEERALEKIRELEKHLIGVRHQVMVVTGDAAPEIVAAARAMNADLIVMGTHGRHGIARAVLGSVAERVTREAPCPVLTTH